MISAIKKILEENNIDFVFHPKNENLPVDKIDVKIIIENYPPELTNVIEIIFIPGIEEATEGLSMLQFYTILNLKITEKETILNDLMKLLSDINYTLVAGAFNLNLREENIYLKYNLAIDQATENDLELKLSRIIWFINQHFNTYVKMIVEVNNESTSYSELKTKEII
jgi:hypothetical protein